MASNNIDALLKNRYVIFSCEGTAEEVVIGTLIQSDSLIVPAKHIVDDPILFTPYTRLRKASDIANRFFRESYEGDGASGLLVVRIVDSRSGKFTLPKRWENVCEVRSLYTRPEIEMLVIHAEGAYGEWQRASRRNKTLKPNEFCKGTLKLADIKEKTFLQEYWTGDKLVKAIREYDRHRSHANGELSLAALLHG